MPRRRRRGDRLDEPARPGEQQPRREQQVVLAQREEQAVAPRSRPPPAAPEPLQERGDRERRVDLDHPVQVTDVDAELKRGRGHDHAVPPLGERQLRPPPLVKRQRRVDQVRGDAELPQLRAELLDEPLGVAEDEALLAPVQRRDDLGGVRHAPHVVQLDVRVRCGQGGGDRLGFVRTVRPTVIPSAAASGATTTPVRCPAADPCSQVSSSCRVADGRRQPDPLERTARDARQPFEDGDQVPAPVPGAEGMRLVHDHGPQVSEQPPVVHAGADEHGLKRLRRGEQQVGQVGEHGLAAGRRGVAMPERDPAARPGAVDLKARQQVVEQRLQRAQVDHRQAGPALGGHPGQHREGGRLGLAARGGREQQCVVTAQHRSERVALERAERGPAERVHHVVGQRRVQAAERPAPLGCRRIGHRSRSTSSAVAGRNAAALRSVAVSSVGDRVSL